MADGGYYAGGDAHRSEEETGVLEHRILEHRHVLKRREDEIKCQREEEDKMLKKLLEKNKRLNQDKVMMEKEMEELQCENEGLHREINNANVEISKILSSISQKFPDVGNSYEERSNLRDNIKRVKCSFKGMQADYNNLSHNNELLICKSKEEERERKNMYSLHEENLQKIKHLVEQVEGYDREWAEIVEMHRRDVENLSTLQKHSEKSIKKKLAVIEKHGQSEQPQRQEQRGDLAAVHKTDRRKCKDKCKYGRRDCPRSKLNQGLAQRINADILEQLSSVSLHNHSQ